MGTWALRTLAALCLASVLAAADQAGGDLLSQPAAPRPAASAADADLARLVADGKAAATLFSSDQTRHAGAIVDAAVAFETARQRITGATDRDLVTAIQENLYWCRKQMDLDTLTAFKARMRNEDHKPAPLRLKPMAAPPPPKPAAPVVAGKARPEGMDAWLDRLRLRMQAGIAAGRPPQFRSSLLKATTTVTALAADGTMTTASDNGSMVLPWRMLTDSDLLGIALDVTRDEVPEQHALAAFYLLLVGDRAAAQMRLAKAGSAGDEVTAAFSKLR